MPVFLWWPVKVKDGPVSAGLLLCLIVIQNPMRPALDLDLGNTLVFNLLLSLSCSGARCFTEITCSSACLSHRCSLSDLKLSPAEPRPIWLETHRLCQQTCTHRLCQQTCSHHSLWPWLSYIDWEHVMCRVQLIPLKYILTKPIKNWNLVLALQWA